LKPARACALLSYLLLCAPLAHAALPLPEGGQEVTIKADTLSVDVPTDQYRAQGGVRIEQDGVSLLADSVIYSRLSGQAVAEGAVFFERDGDTLKGDRLSLNLVSQKGELSNGELFVKKSNFHVRAQRLEKTGEAQYRLERGSFTTCDGENPSWRFEARKVEVAVEEFATARDAVFYAGDIPILYTPYLIFPVKTERQSGLLIPKFGHSTKKGFYLDLPYYWAINPSQDATFDLDLESARGVGLGVDYRYLRGGGSEGRLQSFGIYDTGDGRFRGELNQRHLELLSPRTTLASDIHLLTDRDYYRDFGDFSGEYNRQLQVSTISFDHRWQRYGLAGELRYTEDLLAPTNDASLQRLPELNFIGAGEKLGPFFLSMDSRFVNFQRGDGLTGQRLELHPRLTLYAKPAGLLDLSLYAGYLERFYNASANDAGSELQELGQADGGGVLALPLERIYQGRVRHLLVPALEYRLVQSRRDDNLPFFDWNDRVLGQSMATWSLASVVTGKYTLEGGVAEYRDLLYLKLSQGYQFAGERRDEASGKLRDLLTLVDEGHRLTDLMLESRFNPVPGIALAADGRYNPVDNNLSTANAAFEWKGEGKNQALLGYRYSRSELDYLEGRLAFPLGKSFSGTVLGRYSFDKGGFLESRYALEYRHQCWSIVVSYADRPGSLEIPRNREFTVNFSLAGIGALGPIKAF
jgi:LPS-assembly protein